MIYEIFTDGSYCYFSKIGSYGFCVFERYDSKLKLVYTESGIVEKATSNRAEYVALIKACEYSNEIAHNLAEKAIENEKTRRKKTCEFSNTV